MKKKVNHRKVPISDFFSRMAAIVFHPQTPRVRTILNNTIKGIPEKCSGQLHNSQNLKKPKNNRLELLY